MALVACIAPDVLVRELAGESVILDLKTQRYYGLDEVGTRIWQLLRERRRADLVFRAMLDEFEVGDAEFRRDFTSFLGDLEDAGLIELEPVDRSRDE